VLERKSRLTLDQTEHTGEQQIHEKRAQEHGRAHTQTALICDAAPYFCESLFSHTRGHLPRADRDKARDKVVAL